MVLVCDRVRWAEREMRRELFEVPIVGMREKVGGGVDDCIACICQT